MLLGGNAVVFDYFRPYNPHTSSENNGQVRLCLMLVRPNQSWILSGTT